MTENKPNVHEINRYLLSLAFHCLSLFAPVMCLQVSPLLDSPIVISCSSRITKLFYVIKYRVSLGPNNTTHPFMIILFLIYFLFQIYTYRFTIENSNKL